MLDEEASNLTENALVEKLFNLFNTRDDEFFLRKTPESNEFILQHLQGTRPILYNANEWLKYSKENPITQNVIAILQKSNK